MFKIIDPNAKINPADIIKAEKRFEWQCGYMIAQFKFVHQILMMMTKCPRQNFNTMGVRVTPEGKFELIYDPIWSLSLIDSELTYILYHEILHLALHHCTKRPLTQDLKERHLANIAHDLAVNELIPDDAQLGCCKPKLENGEICGCHVSELKKKKEYSDIEDKQSSEWYWDYLHKKQKELGGLPHLMDCDGDCANCKLEKSSGSGGLKPKQHCKKMDDHGGWQEHEMADDHVTAKIKEVERLNQWGDVSQGVRETIMAAQIKKVNWRNKIRVWFGNHAWKDKTTTRKKPNRRTGFIHPGYKQSYVDKYLVAADTSGSIGEELLGEWIGVLNQLVEYLPIDIMQFDCEKQTNPEPYDRRRLKLEFKGRGGTNFSSVIDLVNKQRYKGVMILTDGCAEAPDKPHNAHVLWVLPSGCNPPVEWGDRVHLVKHA